MYSDTGGSQAEVRTVTITELIWEGRYDEKGNLKPADKTILAFQVVEAVNGSKAEGEKAQRDWVTKLAQDTERRDMLIWGFGTLSTLFCFQYTQGGGGHFWK